jgi:hypothetical protein
MILFVQIKPQYCYATAIGSMSLFPSIAVIIRKTTIRRRRRSSRSTQRVIMGGPTEEEEEEEEEEVGTRNGSGGFLPVVSQFRW